MQTINKQTITIDLKRPTMIPLLRFIQGDTNQLEIVIKDDGQDADFTNIGRIVSNFKRKDKKVISRLLNASNNKLLYQFGTEENLVDGESQIEIQFFSQDNIERKSTMRFNVYLFESIGTKEISENDGKLSLLQELFVEVETVKQSTDFAAQYANEAAEYAMGVVVDLNQAVNSTKINWLTTVPTYASISTTYPNPTTGDTVQVDNDKFSSGTFRYNGTEWVKIQNPTGYANTSEVGNLGNLNTSQKNNLVEAVNETVAGLADTVTEINNLQSTKADKSEINTLASEKANKDEVQSLVTNKAEKTYVDQQIANVASGSPKGAFPTLSALQSAFPTGTTGIYVVTADGKWYYWNGSAWTAGAVYQSTLWQNALTTQNGNWSVV